MFELTMGGRAMSGLDAVNFFERLADTLGSEELCDEYEYALNRLRYEVAKSVPVPPKEAKGRFTSYSCGKCGGGVRPENRYCPRCGTKIEWIAKERDNNG